MTFLPNGYEKPAGNSNYFKFEEGDNKFRIMSSAIVGYEYWTTENQPVRSKEQFTETPNIKVDQNGKKRIRHFWAFIAWDYKEGKLKIMQITQSSIQDAILTLHSDEGWGDPKEYDLNVVRKGESIETTYNVIPTPPTNLKEEVLKAYNECDIKLEALYTGADPFEAKEELATEEDAVVNPF